MAFQRSRKIWLFKDEFAANNVKNARKMNGRRKGVSTRKGDHHGLTVMVAGFLYFYFSLLLLPVAAFLTVVFATVRPYWIILGRFC